MGRVRSAQQLIRPLAVVSALAIVACAPRPPAPSGPKPVPLHLEPACDLAPAAGVEWVVEVKPRAIAEVPDLIPAIGLVLPEERLQVFAAAHGGIDLRQTKDLCVAQYKDSSLAIVSVPLDPDRVAQAFAARTAEPPVRTILAPNPLVLRLAGRVQDDNERLTLFGRDAAALERGTTGPLRAAEAFAFMKLKKATPALRGAALSRASEVVRDAPVRAFAAGPFEGEVARGLGGILRATTAVGAAVKWTGQGTALDVRIALVGAWGDDGPAAAQRLAAAANVLADSAIGRLLGLDQPIRSPTARAENDALVLEATLDGAALARGLHAALDAEIADIMRR
ncbi:MAG: hypothetical protein KIT84_17900 [Labilithrix sp.]|nr:hypothetical protein [Labilithrix sp.]MCW5812906.1 hypothetical protein [Labilithrix sp.]